MRESKDILLILYIYIFLLHYSHDLIKKEREKKKVNKMVIIETRELNLFDSPVSNLHTQTFNIPTRETITDCVLYKANTIIKEEQLSRGKNTPI